MQSPGIKEVSHSDQRQIGPVWTQENFKRIAHFMKYCQTLRERRVTAQTVLLSRLGIAEGDIILQQGFAGMLKPSYVLVLDHRMRCVVLAIRGTHSVKVSKLNLAYELVPCSIS